MKKQYIRRTPEQWQSILADQSNSGLSQQNYCLNKNIAFSTFHSWRKRLSGKSAEPVSIPDFVELPSVADSQSLASALDDGLQVRVELGGGIVLELFRR